VPALERHRHASRARDAAPPPPPANHGGLSVTTLAIASASSLVAALVVSRLWGAGTLAGAAVTPVVVALVAEALHRPRRAIQTVRQTRVGDRYDPLAEGRAGLLEGDLATARAPAPPPRTVHRVTVRRPGRRAVVAALVTGIAAFAIAALVLTSGELVFGGSASTGDGRTTLFGGSKSGERDAGDEQAPAQTPSRSTEDRGTGQPPATDDGQQQPATPGGGSTQPTTPEGGTTAPPGGGSTTPAPTTPAPSTGEQPSTPPATP
jgi:hypothetical protein